MIREVDLVSYLPPFLAEYKEINETLAAETPEFMLVWKAADRVLRNEFIAVADEYGISRFERMLKIYPSKKDTLESRRVKVQGRWFASLPYTMKMLLTKLKSICGDTDFTVIKEFDYYRIVIETNLELFGQVEELEQILNTMLPCNMNVILKNRISCAASGKALAAGGIRATEFFVVPDDYKERIGASGKQKFASGVSITEVIRIKQEGE